MDPAEEKRITGFFTSVHENKEGPDMSIKEEFMGNFLCRSHAVDMRHLVVVCCLAFWTFAQEVPFGFSSQPVLFDTGDTYTVVWSTTDIGSAKVEIRCPDGGVLLFSDAVDGLGDFQTRIHGVRVPKELLETAGTSYRASSRRTIDTSRYGYKFGEEVISGFTALRPKKTGAEISFLAFSDVQGGEKYVQQVIAAVTEPYDFVVALGDYSNWYNCYEDYINPLLIPAYQATKGEIPLVYVGGNHEIKGSWAKQTNRFFPTPSPDNQRYYTWSYGPLFVTTLFFGDDHGDDMPRYSGVSEFDAYKDGEYEWLERQKIQRLWGRYRYHLAFCHIPLLAEENLMTADRVCKECNKAHGYKQKEFGRLLEKMDVQAMLSGHTHQARLCRHPDLAFSNLQIGGIRKGGYKASLIRLVPGKMGYTIYGSDGSRESGEVPVGDNRRIFWW